MLLIIVPCDDYRPVRERYEKEYDLNKKYRGVEKLLIDCIKESYKVNNDVEFRYECWDYSVDIIYKNKEMTSYKEIDVNNKKLFGIINSYINHYRLNVY